MSKEKEGKMTKMEMYGKNRNRLVIENIHTRSHRIAWDRAKSASHSVFCRYGVHKKPCWIPGK